MTALDCLADEPRWVAWRNEARGGGKLTKVPYAPGGGAGKANDPSSWGTRAEAEARAAKIINGNGGGIGIELGNLGGDAYLGGIDLDTCLGPDGKLAAWAEAILHAASTYAELSPSGTGLKVFFYVATEDVRPFLDLIGVGPEQWGTRRDAPGEDARDHGPAIEVYFSRRYFAVTGQRWPSQPNHLALLDWPSLERLARLVPSPKSNGLSHNGTKDTSRSAIAFRKGRALRRGGNSFAQMVEALRTDSETADWVCEKGMADGMRELHRIWERAAIGTPAERDHDPELAKACARFLMNDIGNAERLVRRFSRELLYVVGNGWFAWDGRRWKRDDEGQIARSLSKRTARAIFHEAPLISDLDHQKERAKWAVKSGNAARVAAMLSMAEPDLIVTLERLDADPWLFNVLNGTIDLRTGRLRSHQKGDYITKLSPIKYEEHAECPRWDRFLEEIFTKDHGMIEFVTRTIGYSLTGLTIEQVLFILHGLGDNGKTVLLELLSALFGDYAMTTPVETLMVKDRAGIPNDIARLRGARLVSARESEKNQRLAEAMIKQMTGGDKLTARFLNKEWFEYKPAFKLWLATNHKPKIRGSDHAIWKRIRLLPFNVRFFDPPGTPTKDRSLSDALRAELPGILASAVCGCLNWQKDGLKPPSAVLEATEAYRQQEESTIQQFVAEKCETTGELSIKFGDLYGAYKEWAAANNEQPASSRMFSEHLDDQGFPTRRGAKGTKLKEHINLRRRGDG
jgi:putative DNA primase/helicase